MKTRVAKRIEEVLPVLEFAESEARAGSYVAVMLSYEAAPAFDSAFVAHPPSDFPLAWASSDLNHVNRDNRENPVEGLWSPLVSRADYDRSVTRIRELIAAGDTYQVNYSFPLTTSFNSDPYSWYRSLCMAQRAPYSTYLDLGRYKVLCLSPELFFERRGDHVITKPMKGTIRRGRWLEEDQQLARHLRESTKDRAENVMIVDLLRNDLGKVSVPGSVRVSSLFDVERFETVWQMTSTVESTLRSGTSLVDLMTALFPCGSITGAPKIRTMEIIRELEPFTRGAYTGAIGFIQPGGDCIFNVAIRTVVVDTELNVATFGVGGGVTIDSTAEREYEECLVKSNFLHAKPEEFQLFESILLEDGEYFLLEQHLERLDRSAAYFGFGPRINADFERIAAENSRGVFKVRVMLSRDGRVETNVAPVEIGGVRRVSLAARPVDSSDRFLYHKTTRRDFYVGGEDVIYWNERGEITESSIANVVVRIGDQLFTPPVESGLLAGTYRNELLIRSKIAERVITIDDLRSADQIFLINSVRKWMRAELVVEKDL
ncbi:MAG TPA: aminodeoxychorismate synthase component I [Pyrinomonadaceae bacterium]|nr:aminodeoxychorismate synthase component I [Pyrinomonadaceae bacterium]